MALYKTVADSIILESASINPSTILAYLSSYSSIAYMLTPSNNPSVSISTSDIFAYFLANDTSYTAKGSSIIKILSQPNSLIILSNNLKVSYASGSNPAYKGYLLLFE